MSKPFYKGKKANIKVRLLNDSRAIFYEYFHKGSSTDDLAYKLIKKECDAHSNTMQVEPFRRPYNRSGFKFKYNLAPCTNENKESCLIDDIFDKDVIMSVTIKPYDFTGDGDVRLVGVSITANSIRAIKGI